VGQDISILLLIGVVQKLPLFVLLWRKANRMSQVHLPMIVAAKRNKVSVGIEVAALCAHAHAYAHAQCCCLYLKKEA
jgi:hypothetical protein